MKRKLTLALIALLFYQFEAQNFIWAKTLGSTVSSAVMGNGITVDKNGNVITTGYHQNTGDFDPGSGVFNLTCQGQEDAFVSKLDASGNFVWAKQFS